MLHNRKGNDLGHSNLQLGLFSQQALFGSKYLFQEHILIVGDWATAYYDAIVQGEEEREGLAPIPKD